MENIVLPKLISSGIYNSKVVFKDKKYSPKRNTNLFEIELPIREMGKSFIDNKSKQLNTNTVICAKPNQVRYTKLDYMCYYVHFVVNDGLLYEILMGLPNFIDIKSDEHYLKLMKKIDKYNKPGIMADNIIIQSALLELIYSLYKETSVQTKNVNINSNNRRMIEEVIKYIDDNLSGDLTLKTISAHVSLSPVYFHRVFKTSTGLTLHDYVEDRRIKRAVELLVSTDMTLTEIAYECGFSSQSYFSYAFRKRMKQTPRNYVKSVYKNYEI